MKLKNPTTAHMERQDAKRKQALAESEHAALNLSAKGEPLKKQRTGTELRKAIAKNMQERGYVLTARKLKVRPARSRKSIEVIVPKWTRVSS